MEGQLSLFREKLSSFSYNEVRKEAKKYSISARGKKTEIIDRILKIEAKLFLEQINEKSLLLEVVPSLDIEPSNVKISPKDVEAIDDTLNDTYTLETPNDEEFLSDDDMTNSKLTLKTSLTSDNAKNISLMSEDASQNNSFPLNLSTIKMDILPDLDNLNEEGVADVLMPKHSTKPEVSKNKEQALSKLKKPTSVVSGGGRYALQHKKLFEDMSSISDVKQKSKNRVDQVNNALSSRLKQLASPKKTRQTFGAQFAPPVDPSTLSFRFGNVPVTDYPKVQNQIQTPIQSRLPVYKSRRSLTHSVEKKLDVKQMTMSASRVGSTRLPGRQFRQATTPVLTPRLERLATPKGTRANLFDEDEENTDSSNYQPHKGRFKYVDTTKMTDREFKAYLRTKAQKFF